MPKHWQMKCGQLCRRWHNSGHGVDKHVTNGRTMVATSNLNRTHGHRQHIGGVGEEDNDGSCNIGDAGGQ